MFVAREHGMVAESKISCRKPPKFGSILFASVLLRLCFTFGLDTVNNCACFRLSCDQYLLTMMGVFGVIAWLGCLIDNLLLTYLIGNTFHCFTFIKCNKVITTLVIRPLDDPHMMCSICGRDLRVYRDDLIW